MKKFRLVGMAARLVAAYVLLASNVFAAPMAAFVPNNQPVGWVGPVAVSSFNFGLGNQVMFRGDYEKGNYSGNVWADQVDTYGSVIGSPWDGGAAAALDAQSYDTGRLIVTRNGANGIPFRWANMSTAQQDSINTNDGVAKDIVNYIRGQRTKEVPNGLYRKRSSALGDIIHSRPLFVPDPSNSPPDPALARVYVGGNDGMLHVFDACMDGCATAGNEVWAYVPSMLISNLKQLTVNPYTTHQYFVDGSANARTVTIGGITKTILVGTLGAGGIGMYALDISDPAPTGESTTTAAALIKWEITNTQVNGTNNGTYADMGYIYGPPLIVRLNDSGTPGHTWAAIVGNGYNSTNSTAANGGKAALFVINLDTGALIKQLTVPPCTGQSNTTPNGLSRPAALDVNGDGYIDYVYAGDICGNLWKFDLRNGSPGSWPNPTSALFANPLIGQPNSNAITGAPSIAPHPKGGRMITVGTGRLFTATDVTDITQQYVYGFWDNDVPASGTLAGTTINTANLVSQSLSNPIAYSGGIPATVRTSGSTINTVDYAAGKQGWRLSLASGERVVGDGGYIADYRYQFATANPNKNNGTDANGNALATGDNWLIEVDFLTGAAPSAPFLDLNASQTLESGDLVAGGGTIQSRVPIARQISIGGVISQPILAQLALQSQTYFNINPDAAIASTANTGGVANGHFDFDLYYGPCVATTANKLSCKKAPTHKHEYDDIYNVTGVDMQNSSLPAMNLATVVTNTATKFKILVANQKLSPAAQLKIGDTGAVYMSDTVIQTAGWPLLDVPPVNLTDLTTPSFSVNALPTYSRAGGAGTTKLANLYINLPLDSFTQKDWVKYWASGGSSGGTCTPTTNVWTAGGSMSATRQNHTATLLGSTGKVLVAGGFDGTSALSSAELYDPIANTWTTVGSLGTARQNHVAVALADGRVLVVGGVSGAAVLASAEIYDPATGIWTGAGNMPVSARQGHTATLLANGKVLVSGGLDPSGTPLNTAVLYDPAANGWSSTANTMTATSAPRAYHTATLLLNGKVLIAGGLGTANSFLKTTELYDPATNTWAAQTGLPQLASGRHHHAAVLLATGPVLVTGGLGSTGVLASAELANATATASPTAWASAGTMSVARMNHTATLLATTGRVLVTGGSSSSSGNTQVAAAEFYTSGTTWASANSMSAARSFQTATQLAGSKVLVAGGTSGSALASADLYDPDTNCRVGLVPTQTTCVHANQGGYPDSMAFGPYGNLWMNGALTIQIIKDTTPDSAIRLASTAGDPTFGYRLKSDNTSQTYMLAQYTIFWHHDTKSGGNGLCYGAAGWGTTAAIANPTDAGTAAFTQPAAGSDDPKDGAFQGTGGSTGTGGTSGGTGGTNTTVTYITLADGTVITQTITKNADGTITVTLTGPDGTTSFTLNSQTAGPQHDTRITSGRISWKQLIR